MKSYLNNWINNLTIFNGSKPEQRLVLQHQVLDASWWSQKCPLPQHQHPSGKATSQYCNSPVHRGIQSSFRLLRGFPNLPHLNLVEKGKLISRTPNSNFSCQIFSWHLNDWIMFNDPLWLDLFWKNWNETQGN